MTYDSEYYEYDDRFPHNNRLDRLFEIWPTEEIADQRTEKHSRSLATLDRLELQRETVKYNAVHALIGHLARRGSRKRLKAGKAS